MNEKQRDVGIVIKIFVGRNSTELIMRLFRDANFYGVRYAFL